jgi:hypothetical protein
MASPKGENVAQDAKPEDPHYGTLSGASILLSLIL